MNGTDVAAAAGMRFPLASTAAPRASSTRSDTQQQQQPEQWTIGQLVSIAPRTGPGMNQPGGIAHITGIETTNATVPSLSISTANIAATATATATSITTISVKYVVDGRHERRVPTDCVRPHAWRSTLRDRTLLLGRCGTCGSLRSDCGGSCAATTTRRDFGFYHKTNHAMNNNTSRTNAIRHNPYNGDGGADRVWLDKENSTESQQRTHHGRQRHKQETFKSNSIRGTNWNSDSDEDEEEDNSDDEDFSQECPSRGRRKTTRGSKHQRRRHNNDWATMLKHNRLKAQAERFYAQENLEPVSTKNHGPAVDAAAAVANTNSKSKEEEYNSNDNSNYEDYPLLSLKSTDNASVCTNLNGVAKNPRMRQRLVRRQNRNHIAGKSVLECGVSSSSSTNNTNNSDSSSTSRSAPKRKAGNSTVWKPPPKGVAAAPPPLRSSSQSPHSQEPVSNPGSPDTDLEDRSSLFAGNVWQSHSPAPSSSTTIWSNNNDSSEDHDASVYSSGEDFIQPEGNAQELPLDIVDETKGLDYPAVLSFFDDTMLRLRTKDLPLGQRKVAALESEWVRFPETLQQEDQQRLAKTRKDHLHQKSDMLEVELIKILVHNGFDQCRTALDRLANRSFYKQFKHSIKQGDTISFIPYVGLDDSRWFQLDEVSRSVDDAIVRLRNIPFDSFSDDSLSIGSANSQWADPDSQSPRRSNGLDREDTCDLDKFISPHYDIDNHPYANRKRKYYKTSVVSRKRSHGINFKETRDSDRRPRKTTSNRRICRRDGQTANEKVQEMDDNNLGLVTSDADCSSRETGTPTRKQGYPESTDATRAHKSIAHRCVASRLQRGPMVTKRNVITESVPDLDNILLTRVDSKIRSQRGAGRHNDSKSASDKMTKWLHANAGNDINNHKRNGKKRVMQKQNDKYRAQRMESRDKLCKGPERLDAKITRSSLFSVLRRPNALPKDKRQPNSKGGTVADLCQSLRKTKCAKDCALLIDDIYNVMSSPTHQEVALLFQTMFDLLKAGGCRTLQDLISDSSPALEMHVAVLVGLLRLLRDEVNHALTPSNGLTYQIFGLGHFSAFFDFVVLQLVDSVMSLLLPDAWDLRINGLRAVLAILEPLRDELAGCLPLVDRGCRCLEKQLEQQEWRCVRQGANVFVSSVDPNTWLKYLESATTPQKRQIVRLSSFGQCLPRCEIEAIWSLVAFFASSRNCSDVACDHWKFFTNLLSKGSLCRVAIDLSLPPQSEQLLAAVSDVTNLTDLIASGRMGCLPRRDEALFDILKRAVSLQIDDLLLNDASHSRLYPTVDQDDGSFSLINLSRYTNGVNDTGALKSLSDAASLGNSDVYFMGHPLLLPSSMVLRCCLRLMVVWKNNLPRSVTRQRLFNNAMSSFLKSITATDAVESLAEVQADEDRFSEAFSISSGRPVEGNLDSRRNDFQHECSAYMAMFASGFVMVDQEACASMLCPEKVWALLSNDAMKTFRTRSSERKDIHHAANYHGSNVLIYVCAKVITLSALSWMGASAVEVHPQHPVATTAHGNSFDDASSKECGFAMSCLVTCLECARGSTQNMTIVISVLNYIGIIISAANKKFASLRHRKLIVQSFLNSVSLLKKCFLAVIQAPEHGNEGDFFLQIFFSVSDGIIEMSPSNGLRHDQFSSCRSPEYQDATDECFNDFDDDILASMDLTLGHNDSTASNSIFCFLSSLYDCIAEALVAAKPSARNVSPNINSVDRNHLSTQGMKLVHDRLEVMCLLLADIAAIIWYPTCNIKWLWVVQRRIPTTHDEDTQYFLILAQMITRDICNQRHIPNVVTLVDQFKESTLFTFLEFALESKILVGVPSCNLDRIASSSGQNGRKKGGSDLSNFAKGLPKSLVDGVAAVRKFGGNLGQIFVDIHNKEGNISLFSLGRLMICFEEGYDKNPSLLVPSVESECISRFTLLQGLFRSFSFCGNNWTSFERLSSLLLATCSAELVRLLLKIGIQDIAHQEMLHSVYDRARLFETVTCYSELYVNLMAEVFRTASKYSLSGQFQQLLLYAADSFIFPLISEQSDIPLISYLKEIAYLSIAVLTNSTNSKRGNVDIFSSYDHKPYCNVFREALLRRRKEFTYFVAKYYKSVPSASLSNILSVLFTVGGRNEEMHKVSLRQYFSVTSLATSVTVDTSFTSPLSAGIEECYSHAEDSLSKISMPSVVALKYYSLQQFLIPRLLDRGLSPSTLSEVLLTIQVLLELENERRDGDVTLDLFVLCSLCRGIGTCVCLSLFADDPSLHEDIVAASFSCAMALFNAPATAVDCSASGNVLDWLKASFETIDHGGLEQMHPGNYHAHYIWCFYSWLSDFGNAVKDFSQSSQCRKLLIQLREKRCFELPKRYDWAYFGTTPDRALMFECITELDDILFPVARAANGAPITNVYKSNHSNGPPLISKPGLKSNAFTRGDCLEWNLNSKTDAAICSFLSMQGGG